MSLLTCVQPKTEFSAPLTSFHWNKEAPNLVVTASIDTTCTVWDLNTLHAKTHLIAHDKEVFDVAFVAGSEHIFASCGADGSVRMFDLRYSVPSLNTVDLKIVGSLNNNLRVAASWNGQLVYLDERSCGQNSHVGNRDTSWNAFTADLPLQ